MGLITWIKGVFSNMFSSRAEKDFNIDFAESDLLDKCIGDWMSIYQGTPSWINVKDHIKTINFAKTISSETARLSCLDIGITFDGDARSKWMQQQTDKYILPMMRKWIELACAYGTVAIKPNGSGVDYFTPNAFKIVDSDSNGRITAIVFQDTYKDGKKYYTKLEYHRFIGNVYQILNKAYVSASKSNIGNPILLESTKWAGLLPEASITKANDEKLDAPLFGILKMPMVCKEDPDSPMGAAIFSEAVEELKDLDIAYSRNSYELWQSKRIVLADERIVDKPAMRNSDGSIYRPKNNLPDYVVNVYGDDEKNFYQEINPNLNTDTRKVGMNQQLSFIGYKCGYSNGYFVFDEKTGMVTATQVESDNQRTITLIDDIREYTKNALNDVFYAMSVFADLYNLAPVGEYKIEYSFQDIVYNHEENLLTMKNDAISGLIPKWMYVMEQYSLSEEDAKKWVIEAQSENKADSKLFDDD